MKKEWLLAMVAALATLAAALGLLRWLAPQLLGLPLDMRLVRASTEVPPFFDGVFREEDYRSPRFIIPDPYIKRARPLYPDRGAELLGGPHDILGFRNSGVPNRARIIAVGDSQTYGNSVRIEQNWLSQMAKSLGMGRAAAYNMAVGGWGAVEYFEIFSKALYLQPRLVIVAFYTGNDPLDSFMLAYADERWASLRPDPELQADDAPSVTFPAPESEQWQAKFNDGFSTVFTPTLRFSSNQDHPAVRAGFGIMAEVARRVGARARQADVGLMLTIVPTKELAYARKVERDGLVPPADYSALVTAERGNLEGLAAELKAVPGAIYVDLLAPLQSAALDGPPLYDRGTDGHPIEHGNAVIAGALVEAAGEALRASDELSARTDALFAEAMGHQRAGRRDEAIRLYEELLAMDPDVDQAAFNLAYALIAKATPFSLDRAVEVLERLAVRRPDYTEVLYRLGEAHRLRGDGASAGRAYRRFLDAGGHRDLVSQARERLAEIERSAR